MFADTHCHLDFDAYDADRAEVILRARQAGLAFLVNPSVDLPSTQAVRKLTADYPGYLFAAVGIHPNFSAGCEKDQISRLEELAAGPEVVAIGEIGLDYYRDYSPPAQQRCSFLWQLELAALLELPVIIHDRDASQDLLPILKDWHGALPPQTPIKRRPGVMHAYSGSAEQARALAELGFCFGLGGPVTYQNAQERRWVAAQIPLGNILLETDAPFLTPHPHRGKRNEPAYIPLIAETIAALHGISAAELGEITTANAAGLFGLRDKPETSFRAAA
jgi:TatD DNase family protein